MFHVALIMAGLAVVPAMFRLLLLFRSRRRRSQFCAATPHVLRRKTWYGTQPVSKHEIDTEKRIRYLHWFSAFFRWKPNARSLAPDFWPGRATVDGSIDDSWYRGFLPWVKNWLHQFPHKQDLAERGLSESDLQPRTEAALREKDLAEKECQMDGTADVSFDLAMYEAVDELDAEMPVSDTSEDIVNCGRDLDVSPPTSPRRLVVPRKRRRGAIHSLC